jgi:hypothetical protein
LIQTLEDAKVLGVGIEVNFFGSEDPQVHTFHNVDRLMKQNGFELFCLSTRPSSSTVSAHSARKHLLGPNLSRRRDLFSGSCSR